MAALIEAARDTDYPAEIALVLSNDPAAAGLERARAAGIATAVIDHRAFGKDREAFERKLQAELEAHRIDLVCLAGFMRLLGVEFVDAFPHAVLNIHPSLLPAFPGMDAQHQAWEHGVKVSGATVHFVTADLDAGPIVLQQPVAVAEDDTPDTLSARILAVEHQLYPEAIERILDGHWRVEGRRVVFEQPPEDYEE